VVLRRQVSELTQHQPSRLSWCAALHRRIGHGGTGLHRPRPRSQPLGLAELREVAEHGRPSASIALPLNLLLQLHARSAPSIPAVEQVGLVRIQHTGWSGPDRGSIGSDILRDSFPVEPDLLGNRPERPALLRQMADLLIVQAPVGVARGCPCGGEQVGSRLGRRRRRRRLDDHGRIHAGQGEPGGWPMDIL
jgi:hypothetical protein